MIASVFIVAPERPPEVGRPVSDSSGLAAADQKSVARAANESKSRMVKRRRMGVGFLGVFRWGRLQSLDTLASAIGEHNDDILSRWSRNEIACFAGARMIRFDLKLLGLNEL